MEKKQSRFKNPIYISNSKQNNKEHGNMPLKLSSSTTNIHLKNLKYKSSRNMKFDETNSHNKYSNHIFGRKIITPSIKPLETEPNCQKNKLNKKIHQKESSKPFHRISSSTYLRRNNYQNNIYNYNRRNIKIPKNDNNTFIVNNLTYYIRCPHCHNVLNQEPKKGKEIYKIYHKMNENDKENLDENIRQIIKEHTYDTNPNLNETDIFYENYNMKNYYLNERGGVVFKSQDGPINNILIIHRRDYSRYQKETKVLGKRQNIGIYESPPLLKKVFIRPINI